MEPGTTKVKVISLPNIVLLERAIQEWLRANPYVEIEHVAQSHVAYMREELTSNQRVTLQEQVSVSIFYTEYAGQGRSR